MTCKNYNSLDFRCNECDVKGMYHDMTGYCFCSRYESLIKENILTCPFCGKNPNVIHNDTSGYAVVCANKECDFMPSTLWYGSKSDAINKWNTRY